ncbi:hypothetical protein C9J03_15030 [Photobacterium gaetbulicola]|uniref:Lipoprotein n=1 Tax=Photobacterium gaetbulicola Gung47 TaxID=658445 RepID=A0A0C5WQ71_9GAMM|nr:hypothetical protein [Photobacterium gaetbulicola]AJR05110.1 hypothetical protein H744_1c0078 [Photobacterium gaetbulicola Gung47]PSU06863.1 hypothetical protein C9J03_15030 [Photobacterium gaetbulicola]
MLIQRSLLSLLTITFTCASAANEADIQDMSDPLAVYTQAGLGYTDKGLNLKLGQTYDTGNDTTMGMNIIEIKGVAGQSIGWSSRDNDDSIDSIRFRNFGVDLTNGRGAQIDVSWDFDSNQGSASYSLIQALPQMGRFNFYPLAGVGLAAGEELPGTTGGNPDADQVRDRYNLHGTFYVAGMYSKMQITDNVWLNYNPMYLGTISGSSTFKDTGFEGDSSVLAHEFAASYQLTPQANIRYFANWTQNTDFNDGDHRIEFNYQL